MSSEGVDGWDWAALALGLAISLSASGCEMPETKCSELTVTTADGETHSYGTSPPTSRQTGYFTVSYRRSGDTVRVTETEWYKPSGQPEVLFEKRFVISGVRSTVCREMGR